MDAQLNQNPPYGGYVLQVQHEECIKRIQAENDRQNHRIAELEQTVKQIHDLILSVEKLSNSINHMTEQLKDNTEKIKQIERIPNDHVGVFVKGLIGAVAGIVGAGICYAIIGGIR